MTTVNIVTSPEGKPTLAKISLSWQQVTERFSVRFDEQFQGKRKAHFDTLPEPFRTVDGAKGKWMLLVMMDAIVYFLENDQPIESARRYFHQQRVLSETIMAEIITADAEIKANFGPQLPVEVFIDALQSPWDSLSNFREFHTTSTPTKAKQKYLTVLDLLTNHHTVNSLHGNMILILSQTVTRAMNCWSSFEEALGPHPSSSPALLRRSMSVDSSCFDREDDMSSPVGMDPMLGALRPFYQAQRRRSHSPTQIQIYQQQYHHQQQQQFQFQQSLPVVPRQSSSLAAATSSSSSSSLSISIPSAQRFQSPHFNYLVSPHSPDDNGGQQDEFNGIESMENVFGPRDDHDHADDDHMDIADIDLLDVNMHQLDWDAFMTEIAHGGESLPEHHHSVSTDSFYLAGMRTASFFSSDNQLMPHHAGAGMRSGELHNVSSERDEEMLAKLQSSSSHLGDHPQLQDYNDVLKQEKQESKQKGF